MNIAAIVTDILILAVIALLIVISAKRGFVKTLIGFLGSFAVLVLAVVGSWMISDLVYGNFVKPSIVSKLETALTDSADTSETSSFIIDNAVEALPDYIVNMAQTGGHIDSLQNEDKSEQLMSGASSAAQVITDTVVRPVVTGLIQSVSMIFLFIIGMFAVKLISNAMSSVFSGKLLGGINSFLGGLVGVLEGLLFAVIAVWVVGFSISVTKNGILGLNDEIIDKTFLFRIINSFNPLIK